MRRGAGCWPGQDPRRRKLCLIAPARPPSTQPVNDTIITGSSSCGICSIDSTRPPYRRHRPAARRLDGAERTRRGRRAIRRAHRPAEHDDRRAARRSGRRIEALGFDWISIWDHFYAADDTGDPHCLEAVASHAALARDHRAGARAAASCTRPATGTRRCSPTRWRRSTRSPTAASRSGSAAGGCEDEYAAYGIHYGAPAMRLRMLDEYDPVRARPAHAGAHRLRRASSSRSTDAQCEPKPVQARLPIWIGGGGEKVTLRIAARARRRLERAVHPARGLGRTRSACSTRTATRVGRDPATIEKAVNVGMAFTDDDLEAQFGAMAKYVTPGVLSGSVQEMVDQVGAYVDAGAEWVILAMRAPFDLDGLDTFAAEVLPAAPRERAWRARADDPSASSGCDARSTGEWVAIVGTPPGRDRTCRRPACPFCVGGLEAPDPYDGARVREPVAAARARRRRSTSTGSGRRPASPPARRAARAEVVLYSPEHDGSLATIGVDGVRTVVDLWADAHRGAARRDPRSSTCSCSRTAAPRSARRSRTRTGRSTASRSSRRSRPARPRSPPRTAARCARSSRPRSRRARGWCTTAATGRRTCRSPPGHPFATLVAPRTHVADLAGLDDTGRDGLAAALVDVVGRYDRLFDAPLPYLMWIHQGVHLHVHFAPVHRAPGVAPLTSPSAEVGRGDAVRTRSRPRPRRRDAARRREPRGERQNDEAAVALARDRRRARGRRSRTRSAPDRRPRSGTARCGRCRSAR